MNTMIKSGGIIQKIFASLVMAGGAFISFSCTKYPEMTLEEIEAYRAASSDGIIAKTISKPLTEEKWVTGKQGGVWNGSISGEPKSFNLLIAERDGATNGILMQMTDYLVDYSVTKRQWVPRLASFEIVTDEENNTLDVIYTLRDDIYWTFYGNSKPRVKITSDDVVFWYNEIMGDEKCGSSAYNSRTMEMEDGSTKEITIEKVDDRTFIFHFPRIIAEPLLSSNMSFGPAFMYKPVKDAGGARAVKSCFTVADDPKTIPSCGKYFLTEYTPGQRIVYERNPDYWEKDSEGKPIVYPDKMICQIVGDNNTEYLLFKQGKLEDYGTTPEQLEEVVNGANNLGKDGYTVFSSAGNMSASFWTFNQNPRNKEKPYYDWFVKKEFRQAMSCLLNRERIISQTYRGLAEPKYTFFPQANKFYNDQIILPYRFSHSHAQKLLADAGFTKKEDGFLYDEKNRKVEFDLTIVSGQTVVSDIAQIITDECKKEGITVNVRQTDFQRLVEQLTATYDWQTLIIGLNGGSIFPTQGSNVWVSSGNLHMWNPLQKEPATEWEERIDWLYKEASCIVDTEKARPYWDEYQKIILEQCPVVYLVRGRSFYAINNRWDLSNVYYDNINGAETSRVFLK